MIEFGFVYEGDFPSDSGVLLFWWFMTVFRQVLSNNFDRFRLFSTVFQLSPQLISNCFFNTLFTILIRQFL